MLDQATKTLTTLSRRMLDYLGRRLQSSPTQEMAEAIIRSYTRPWAEVFAYTRLAAIADGMTDAWDELPFDLGDEDQQDLMIQAQQLTLESPQQARLLLEQFDPQEQLLIRPWLGLPPPEPPSNLTLTDTGDDSPFDLRLPSYEWALRDLAARHLVTRDEWDQLEQDELAQSFTVAGLETEAAIARVRDVLSNTLAEGWTLEEFKDTAGLNSFLSEAHAETVFRTNLHQSYSDGKLALVESPFVVDAFPYASIDPIGDDRVRKSHLVLGTAGLNGTNIYRIDDPVFQMFRPPWDFNCRCGWGPLTIRQAADKGVAEARAWQLSRTPPDYPEHVRWPTFNGQLLLPSPTFRRAA